MTRFDLRLLGGFQARCGAGPLLSLPAKTQALLAYLALRPGSAHPRDKVAALLWGATSDGHARSSLRQALFALRKAFGEPAAALQSEGHTLSVDPQLLDVDVVAFEQLATAETPEALERAVTLYRGDLLEGLVVDEPAFEEWLLAERERLRELAVEALTKLLARQMQEPATERALQSALRLIALEPLQETVHRTLMRLYVRQGRRSAALKQYQSCVALLHRELGAEPERETKQLYQEILQRRVSAAHGSEPAHGPVEPTPPADRSPELPLPETSLVGRAEELAMLRRLATDASRGRGRVVVITGEAGIGKSSVVATLVTEAHGGGFRVLLGGCYESERILPFGPWSAALRNGQVMSDEIALEGLNPVWRAELARLLPEAAAPGDQPPSNDPLRLFDSVSGLIERLAAAQPVVVALEDLHWADEMSLRLLAFLARRIDAARVLLAVTVREEDIAASSILNQVIDELRREPHIALLRLSPLGRPETVTLVHALSRAGRQTTALVQLEDQVWSLSQGNPFVVVEAMRALGQGMTPVATGSLPLPEAVRRVIATRLDHLSPQSRHVLDAAAVIGHECDFAVLCRASGLGEEDTAGAIEELVRRGVLSGVGERFDFVHDRIRDVAYGQLLPPRRRLMHARVADAIETVHAGHLGEVADRLAHHYAAAENAMKTVEYLARVAESSARAYAHEDAVVFLRRALVHAATLPADARDRRQADLALRIAHSLYFLGRYREALDLLVENQPLIEALADPALAGRHHFALGRYYSLLGNRQLSIDHALRAAEQATRGGDQATVGRAHFLLSQESLFAGRVRDGIEHGRNAVRLLEACGERWWAGNASWITGINCAFLGEFEAALAAEAHTETLGRLIGDDYLVCCAAWASGWILASRGDGAAAVDSIKRALEGSRDHFNTSRALAVLGYAYLETGKPREAIPVLVQALESVGPAGIRPLQGWFMAWLAEAYQQSGELALSREWAAQALEITTAVGFAFGIATARRALGRLDRLCGDLAAAERELRAALDAFTAIEASFESARTRLDLADLARIRGDVPSALGELAEARRAFHALGLASFVTRVDGLATELRG